METARQVVVEFGAEVDINNVPIAPTRFQLDPATFYVTDAQLDFTLVLVWPGADGRSPGELLGWNRLIVQQGKIVIGEPVDIIGHPAGRLKELVPRNNGLLWQHEDFLQYATDTEPGSSGSPVFNDQWEVVALHHAGVPGEADGEWVANEGARVSVILKRLAALELDAERRAILAEMGPESGLAAVEAAGTTAVAASAAGTAIEATAARRGLQARPSAFGGNRHLVFLHGRGQEGKDPDGLRRAWTAGLNRGLTLASLAQIDPIDVWFPFYADRMAEAIRSRESVVVPVDTIDLISANPAEAMAPTTPTTRLLYQELIEEAAAKAGMPPEYASGEATGDAGVRSEEEGLVGILGGLTGRLQNQLSWIAARSGLDDLVIAQFLRDVATYLDEPRVRQAVLDTVAETMPTAGAVTLVGHSLGSVVALDLMTRLPTGVDLEVLVTAGSPLGLDAVFRRLLVGGPNRPKRAGRWLNVWCPADPVTIGCPLRDDWKGQLDEVAVNNPKEQAHAISEYMAHPAIAHYTVRALAA
jgi:endonuclease G, mitochondrial